MRRRDDVVSRCIFCDPKLKPEIIAKTPLNIVSCVIHDMHMCMHMCMHMHMCMCERERHV